MKIFAIRNEADSDATLGFLFYYEKKKRFYIELPKDADEWNTPLLLSSFAKRNQKTVNAHWSRIWVQQRIVPPDRQNLGQILRDNGLKCYDEFELLMLSMGRCAQDDLYLAPVRFDELPEEIRERRSRKINSVVPLEGKRLLVFFENGNTRLCDVMDLVDTKSLLGKFLSIRPDAFLTVHIQTGGYGVSWGENLTISDAELYEYGKAVPLSLEDYRSLVSASILSTAEAAEKLNCSRQNINDLVNRGKLKPVKETEKGKLFLKSDVERREWE